MLPSFCSLAARQTILGTNSMHNTHISIPLGIIIGLFASFIQSLGLTIQRKSHVLNQLLPEHQQVAEHRRPLWLLGFLVFISSNILGSLVQIASLPIVILAPLGAVSLLWNAFFARLILGDVFSPWMIIGTILIAGGAVLIAVFGIVPEPTRSLEDLLWLFSRPAFVIYFSILGVVVLICLVITHVMDYSLSRKLSQIQMASLDISPPSSPRSPTLMLTTRSSVLTTSLAAPIAGSGITTERTPLLDGKYTQPPSPSPSLHKDPNDPAIRSINHTRLLLAISYASFSGIISGMCLIFAKSGVELLLLTVRGQNQFWRWQAWVLVLGLGIFALLQLWYLHKALILANPTLVCPLAFCFYNLSSIVNGLVYFNQVSLLSRLQLGLVILGIAILLGGVWVVSMHSGGGDADWSSDNEDSSDARDVETDLNSSDTENTAESRMAIRQGKYRESVDPTEQDARPGINAHIPPEINELGLDFGLGRHSRSQSTISQRTLQLHMSQSPERQRLETNIQGPLSPTGRVHSQRRRPTVDTCEPSSSRQGYSRTTSNQVHSSYAHLSPRSTPFNTVSTLGTGIQIGLSPVSPGFAIVPRERGRRLTGLGLGAGPRLSDVVLDMTSESREARRRTVSEGDVRKRNVALDNGQSHDHSLEEGRREEDVAGPQEAGVNREGGGQEGRGRERWKWIRNIFIGRGRLS